MTNHHLQPEGEPGLPRAEFLQPAVTTLTFDTFLEVTFASKPYQSVMAGELGAAGRMFCFLGQCRCRIHDNSYFQYFLEVTLANKP